MKQIIATNKAPGAIGPYSQGTVCGNLVFTSGQLGINPETGKLAGQSIDEQAMQALKNLGEVLKAGGADYDTVLKTTVYLQNMSDFATVNAIYACYFKENCPARSCFAVGALPMGGLIEIEAVAEKK